jgi:redox-sensitive bicupin YhaK (pirin superfamily)
MAETILHKSGDRFHVQNDRSDSYFSFSFGDLYREDRMGFGVLRVLNDDVVFAGAGFGSHPHDNMEIITIPLFGALEHQDSMGNIGVIHSGEVQVMSAGTGLQHSEYNHSKTEAANTLQIWLFPKEMNIEPRYDQKSFLNSLKINQFTTLVSPVKSEDTLWINQDAIFSIGDFDASQSISYDIKIPGNGAYIFLIEGQIDIDGTILNKRDALGVEDTGSFTIETKSHSRILIMEVPMR